MKRRVFAILLTALVVLTLAACGASSSSAGSSSGSKNAAADMATAESVEMSTTSSTADYGGGVVYQEAETDGAAAQEQKLIRTAWLELETTSFDEAAQGLAELTESLGGYYENSSVANRSNGSRWADYTIRVPAEQYDAFLNRAGELCHETWRETSQEDVSEVYYDTAGRLKTQQIKLERLQALLAEAEVMEDIITIESAISETEWNIESLSGALRHYDAKVDYATVHINLSEVYKLSNVEEVPDTFGQRLGNAFTGGLGNFADSMEDLAVAFAYNWMWILIWAVVIVVVVRLVRKRGKGLKIPTPSRKKDDKPE